MILLFFDACQVKVGILSKFFLVISQLLPTSPPKFNLFYLITLIDVSTPWGLGGAVVELLSGVVDYLRLVIAWKFVKLLINVLGSKL